MITCQILGILLCLKYIILKENKYTPTNRTTLVRLSFDLVMAKKVFVMLNYTCQMMSQYSINL